MNIYYLVCFFGTDIPQSNQKLRICSKYILKVQCAFALLLGTYLSNKISRDDVERVKAEQNANN